MLGRSTPSSERAPGGPLKLSGSIKSADAAAAKRLPDQPAGTGAAHNSIADDYPATAGLEATPTAPPLSPGEVEHDAQESPPSPIRAPEPRRSDEAGSLAGGQAKHDQPAGDTGRKESDPKARPGPGVRASVAAGGRALLERRGLPSTVVGIALTVLGVALGISSAPSISLLVVGLLMLIVGLLGPRLQGRFALEFGPNGASIEIQTHMAPAGRTRIDGALAPWKPTGALRASGGADAGPKATPYDTSAATLVSEIIEAGGETIELDVKQLTTLLAGAPHGDYPPA